MADVLHFVTSHHHHSIPRSIFDCQIYKCTVDAKLRAPNAGCQTDGGNLENPGRRLPISLALSPFLVCSFAFPANTPLICLL